LKTLQNKHNWKLYA